MIQKFDAERLVVDAFASCDVEDAKSPVLYHVGVVVALVEVPKVVRSDQSHERESVTLLPRETDPPPESPLPAVTVTAPPFTRSELPIVEVATTEPLALVLRSAEARPEIARAEVVALVLVALLTTRLSMMLGVPMVEEA